MKILLDTCVSFKVLESLKKAGYDSEWVGEWEKDPGDEDILEYAFRKKRVLITLDKDFGELAVVHEEPHCGILRLVNLTIQQQAIACLDILKKHEKLLREGSILTAEPGRLRIHQTT